MDYKYVIIVGGNHYNTLGLIRSLGSRGCRVTLILEPCALEFCCLRFSKYIHRLVILANEADLLRILNEEIDKMPCRPFVFCGSDFAMSIIDNRFDRISDKAILFNVRNNKGGINFYMDKVNTFEIAERVGLTLIKTWNVRSGDPLPRDLIYPCLVKGGNSVKSTKQDMVVCGNELELRAAMRPGVDYLLQDFIRRDFEVNVNGLSLNHGEEVLIPAVIHKVRDSWARQGEYLRLEDSASCPQIDIAAIKALLKAIGYEGLFSVEFLVKGNKAYFLEINLRNDGLNYVYTVAGFNMPMEWIYAHCPGRERRKRSSMKLPIYFMLEHDWLNIREGNISVARWIVDVLRARGFGVLSMRDPTPMFYLAYIYMRQALRRVVKLVKG